MKNKFFLVFGLILTFAFSANAVLAQKRGDNKQPPVVTLQSLDGKTIAAGDLKGKVTVLGIGATWLPLSRQQAEILNQLYQTYGKRNVAVYFISTDADDAKSKNYADKERIQGFATRNKISGAAVLRDVNGTTLKFYNLDQIPAFVILNKDGEVVATVSGLDAEEAAKNTVAQISAEIDKLLQ